jgi:hypothetical protein
MDRGHRVGAISSHPDAVQNQNSVLKQIHKSFHEGGLTWAPSAWSAAAMLDGPELRVWSFPLRSRLRVSAPNHQ